MNVKRILSVILIVFFLFLTAKIITISAQTGESFETCMGKALAKYLNTVIQDAGPLSKIKYTSPAFNFTNPQEFQIYNVMKSSGANLGALAAYAGNSYTNVPGDPSGRSAYQWFVDQGWKAAFGGKDTIFTEFGDFKTGEASPGSHSQELLSSMRNDFLQAIGDGSILSVNYFNALGQNPEFAFHQLSPEEYQGITQGAPQAGINSATWVSGGGFQGQVASNNAHWAVEIMNGPDVNTAAASVNAGYTQGVRTVLRLCASGDSCAFSEPQVLVNFLKDLNNNITGPVWVIIGPNEPATEKWAGPLCKPPTKPFVLNEVPCDATTNPEFHSLRPYPTSPCNKSVEESYYICGQDLVVKERFEFTPQNAARCDSSPGADGANTLTCYYSINSTDHISLGLDRARFPIMGNTELVPNGENKGTPTPNLTFLQRVNEYVSWYLNGIPGRAEEDFFSATSLVPGTSGARTAIDLAGPLKKLLPLQVQTNERHQQEVDSEPIPSRHNQIVSCGSQSSPEACYSKSDGVNRLQDVTDPKLAAYFYVPFSSTEDRVGQTKSDLRIAEGSCNGFANDITKPGIQCADFTPVNEARKLYFAHIEEDNRLAAILQGTYKPTGVNESVDDTQLDKLNQTPFCELIETRTNPGDRLYGELSRGNDNTKPISGTLNYTANFQCQFKTPSQTEIDACVPTCNGDIDCINKCSTPSSSCQREVFIPFSVETFTPDLKISWMRFVNGTMSIVKRIFPRIGPDTPLTEIKDIPGETNVSYVSQNQGTSGQGSLISSEALAGNPAENRSGASAKLYFPHVGSIYDYFLKDIQKALRPKNNGVQVEGVVPVTPPPGGYPLCNYGDRIQGAFQAAASKYGVPVEMLQAIFQTEGLDYRLNPTGYICKPNFAGAVGIMQVTSGTYSTVTCPDERMDNDFLVSQPECMAPAGKLSRCDVNTEAELAARILLLKVGHWIYGVCDGSNRDAGDIKNTDINEVYIAASYYYGSCYPDTLTANFSAGALQRGDILACRDDSCSNMGYGDFVCAYMAKINGLNYCNTPDNFPSRASCKF